MKNFIRICLLISEIAQDVLRSFLAHTFQPLKFEDFLFRYKHTIYHLCFNKSPCCACSSSRTCLPRQQIIRRKQFEEFFVQQGQGCVKRDCSCLYIVKQNVVLENLDITLCTTLLVNCYDRVLSQQEMTSLTDIREARNEIAHHTRSEVADVDFNRLWLKVTMAVKHIASSIDKRYLSYIKDRIDRLQSRTVSPEELTNVVLHILEKNSQIEESLEEIKTIVKQIDLNGLQACTMRQLSVASNESHHSCTQETQNAEFSRYHCCNSDNENRYSLVLSEVENLRLSGHKDDIDGATYTILVYIILNGSSSEEDIAVDILAKIYSSVYSANKQPDFNSLIRNCLDRLQCMHLDKFEDIYTARDTHTSQAVVASFGTVGPQCLVKVCNFDIMLDYVVPVECDTDLFHITIENVVLVSSLVDRMQDKNGALHVGKYIRKIGMELKDRHMVDIFLEALNTCETKITPDQIINFLDGLTSEAENFDFFEDFKNIYNTLSWHIDKYENTIFHYLVAKSLESEKFNWYIEYFCENENSMVFMQLENIDKHSPTDFAAYLGRSQILGNILCYRSPTCNTEENSELLLQMVSRGVKMLQEKNESESETTLDVKIDLEKVDLGDKNDYANILELIGKHDECPYVYTSKETTISEKKTEKQVCKQVSKPKTEKTKKSKNFDDDAKAVGEVIGKAVLQVVGGLSKVPDIVDTIQRYAKDNMNQ